jgi:chromosome segregation ATPase
VLELSFPRIHNVVADNGNEQEKQMSNDATQNFPNGPSFEERLFARFDAFENRVFSQFDALVTRIARLEEGQERIEARQQRMEARQERMETRLNDMDQRLQVLENKAYDTKPIWERALAAILELREDVHTLDRKFNIVTRDLMTLRAEQSRLEDRMDKVDSKLV